MNFRVYINRWGSDSTYTVMKTQKGWQVAHIAINGDCDKEGRPFLYANFQQDSVSFPSSIGSFMEHLWQQIEDGAVDDDQAQKMLQELADWVSACERSEPRWPGWN